MELTWGGRIIRKAVKRYLFSMIYFMQGFMVLIGKEKPFMMFTVEGDPPSIYYNFRVREDKAEEFEKYCDLPPGFSIAKMRCLESDAEPFYCLTLNIYEVSGVANGLRAEWSIYVEDPEGRIRYMVKEARSSQFAIDPVDIITKKYKIEHSVKGDTIHTFTTTKDNSHFRASTPVPNNGNAEIVSVAKEWIAANDEIYWGNGIIDRAFYNRGMACTDVWLMPVKTVQLEHKTQWTPFLEAVPEHVVVFPGAIEFVMGPWWNL